ncbi:MAG: hypothetical protein U0518_04970 [Candidatus Gracilibacteria bacterium]
MYIDGYSLGISKALLWISSLLVVLILIVGWYGQSVYVACSSQVASYNALIKGYHDELEGAALLMNTIENISYTNIANIVGAQQLDNFLKGTHHSTIVTLNDLLGEHHGLMKINSTLATSASGSNERYIEISRQIVDSSGNIDHLADVYRGDYNRCSSAKGNLPFSSGLSEYYVKIVGWFDLNHGLPIE